MTDAQPPSKRREPTFSEVVTQILYVNGWSRVLLVEQVGGTRLWRIRIRDLGAAGDFSDADVVGLYTEEELRDGRVTRHSIQQACRKFVLERSG